MKKLFTILAVAAAVVACQKNETIALDNGEAISFGNAFVENSVRAAVDPSYSANDIKSFVVYGTANNVVIYPGTTVTKGTAAYGDAWTCPVKQYWVAGAAYKFVGIVDGNKSGVTETTIVDGMPTTISYKADGATDLLCQTINKTANTDGTANGLVAFNFNHLLSKVNFTVKTTSTAENYSFLVKNIKFVGNTAGVYDIEAAAWDDDSFTKGTTNLSELTLAAEANKTSELTDELLFLPGTYSVSFTVDILANGQPITSTNYPAQGQTYSYTLDAANAYNFVVNVAVGELIQFTVEKQPEWTNSTPYPTPLQ